LVGLVPTSPNRPGPRPGTLRFGEALGPYGGRGAGLGWQYLLLRSVPVTLRVAVLASGRGTNFQALHDACATGYAPAEIVCVITNKKGAPVVERARAAGVETVVVRHKDRDPEEVDAVILKAFEARGVQLACYAGYMRIRGPAFAKAMDGRVLNVHPSLLPAFPGAHPIQDAWDWGVKLSGVTVHFGTEELDMGPIVLQRPVEIKANDTLATFEAKIHLAEYTLYPKAVKLFAEGALRLEGRRVIITKDVADPPWAGDLPPGLKGSA
jgi:phosphoribosylglycinamide formyltransferase-1